MSIRSVFFSSVVWFTTVDLGNLKLLIELVAIDCTHPNCASSWSITICTEFITEEIFIDTFLLALMIKVQYNVTLFGFYFIFLEYEHIAFYWFLHWIFLYLEYLLMNDSSLVFIYYLEVSHTNNFSYILYPNCYLSQT